MASGWRFFLGQPDCPDGLSRSGRGRLVTEVEGKNSAVWEAAGPRGTGFLVLGRQTACRQAPSWAPEAPPKSWGLMGGVLFSNIKAHSYIHHSSPRPPCPHEQTTCWNWNELGLGYKVAKG